MAAIESVKKVDEALGVIGKLIGKLRAQPDSAARKLAEALEEIEKTWTVVDAAITNYLKLGIEDALTPGSKVLSDIEGGRLAVEVEKGRGHCHVIGNIYDNYLDRWFDRTLKGAELTLMRQVFDDLAKADYDVFAAMDDFANQLQQEATEVVSILYAGKVDEAKGRILASQAELRPLRLELSGSLKKLYGLKGEFIKISGVV
jgi:hypothetical protein